MTVMRMRSAQRAEVAVSHWSGTGRARSSSLDILAAGEVPLKAMMAYTRGSLSVKDVKDFVRKREKLLTKERR